MSDAVDESLCQPVATDQPPNCQEDAINDPTNTNNFSVNQIGAVERDCNLTDHNDSITTNLNPSDLDTNSELSSKCSGNDEIDCDLIPDAARCKVSCSAETAEQTQTNNAQQEPETKSATLPEKSVADGDASCRTISTDGSQKEPEIIALNNNTDSSTPEILPVAGQYVGNALPLPSSMTFAEVTSRQKVLVSELDRKCGPGNVGENPTTSAQFQELKQLCQHLQTMLEQQLVQQERLQQQNERLARQVNVSSSKLSSPEHSIDSGQRKTVTEMQQAARILVLESGINQLQKEVETLKSALTTQTLASKRELATLQADSSSRIEQLNRQFEECRREKETMVVRYAQAERKNIELQDRAQKAEGKMKEWARERDSAMSRWNGMKAELARTVKIAETQNAELTSLKCDMEKQKELVSSAELQAKYHQTKLKEEQDRHKETKGKLDETLLHVAEVHRDLELIGQEIHGLNVFLEAQQVAGFPMTTPQIKDILNDLIEKQQNVVKHEACLLVLKEVAGVILRQKDLTDDLISHRDKVDQLTLDCHRQTDCIRDLESRLLSQQQGTGDLLEQVAEIDKLRSTLQRFELELTDLSKCKAELEQTRDELLVEMDLCRQRETEGLQFTERMTAKNSQLQSENMRLTTEMQPLSNEISRLMSDVSSLQMENGKLQKELRDIKTTFGQEREKLVQEVALQAKAVSDARLRIHDLDDEIKTINRRHVSNIKDLTRQLQSASRRLEMQDGRAGALSDPDSDSSSSRTGSYPQLVPDVHCSSTASHNSCPPVYDDAPPIVKVVEVDRQMLFDKIVSLQKSHARKSEKIDFLEDHVNHLIEDINKKNRIIQRYILSQEAGTLSSEKSDKAKAALAKKGGVMASLYSAHDLDGRGMTVDLALQISNKMQGVLEDTLLKNITLKENMDTLGEQVASLMLENRRLRENPDSFRMPSAKRH